jgi:hypothetical protein
VGDPVSPRTDRAGLSAAAAEYLARDWPVAPGAWWSPQLRHYSCGRARCRVTGPHPVDVPAVVAREDVGRCQAPAAACVVRPWQADRWWARHPYALVLPTSGPVSVIEGPAEFINGLDVWLRSQGVDAPLGSAPTSPINRAELFCSALRVDEDVWLAAASIGVLIHGEQSWVTLPPSVTRSGTSRWWRSPAECGWVLPPAELVAEGLRRALVADRPPVNVNAVAAGAVMV